LAPDSFAQSLALRPGVDVARRDLSSRGSRRREVDAMHLQSMRSPALATQYAVMLRCGACARPASDEHDRPAFLMREHPPARGWAKVERAVEVHAEFLATTAAGRTSRTPATVTMAALG
jgi:hypothetical protein